MSEYIFKLPDLGEGMVEAEIVEWMVKVGDLVHEEDGIGSVMTDKAAVELSAPVTGRVLSLAGEIGDMVAVGSPLIVFESEANQPVEEEATAPEPAGAIETSKPEAAPEIATATVPATKIRTSPSIRRRAREAGADLAKVAGSGPRGRILLTDLEVYLSGHSGGTAAGTGKEPAAPIGQTTEIKIVGLRRVIAQRMSQANHDIPHFAYVEEVDVTSLESLRQHLNNKNQAGENNLTLLPFIGLALVRALNQFPQCNALYNQDRNVVIQHQAVHLGIATQTPDGLKVPVVRHSESRGIQDLATEIRRVSTAARENTAKREELMGSTITITSLGKLGGIVTTPIINQPELAIIGVNNAVERPVVVDGQIVIRRMMNLSSSFDHRFVDGYDAASMIQVLKSFLEQPATIFMLD